jgi:hypothetical protein
MAFLTYEKLQKVKLSDSATFSQKALQRSQAIASVFLSHSRKDLEIVEAVEAFLNELNLYAYIDWKDATMPEETSPETARQLKVRIDKCDKFLLLASENSVRSIWVPWELGIADGVKGLHNVAVLPVVHSSSEFPRNAYLGMYPRVEQAKGGEWFVYPPGKNSDGFHFPAWLIHEPTVS